MHKPYAGAGPFALTRFDTPPGRTALVAIDMQNDFLHPEGWYARQGIDTAHMRAAIEPTALLEDCGPAEGDRFVDKQRLSAFFGTNLELVLRALGAETVLFCGVLTNQCVAATGKDASFRDLQPIVVREATGTTLPHLHEPALEMMAVGWAEVRGLDDALAALRAMPLVNEPAGGTA